MKRLEKILGTVETLVHYSHYIVFIVIGVIQLLLPSLYSKIIQYYYLCENNIFTFTTVFFSIIFAIYLSVPNKKTVQKLLGQDFSSFTKFLSTMFLCSIFFISLVALIPSNYATKICILNNIKLALFSSFFFNMFRVSYIIKKLNEVNSDETTDEALIKLNQKVSHIEYYVKELYNKTK